MIYLVLCQLNFISFFLPFFLASSLVWGNNRHLGVSSPSHPNISVQILHTVLSTSHEVLTRRICLTIKSFLIWGFEVHNMFHLYLIPEFFLSENGRGYRKMLVLLSWSLYVPYLSQTNWPLVLNAQWSHHHHQEHHSIQGSL